MVLFMITDLFDSIVVILHCIPYYIDNADESLDYGRLVYFSANICYPRHTCVNRVWCAGVEIKSVLKMVDRIHERMSRVPDLHGNCFGRDSLPLTI